MEIEKIFFIFMGVWIVLGMFSMFFIVSKNTSLKKKLYVPYVIVVGLIFVLFTYLLGFDGIEQLFVIPIVIFMSILNMRFLKFCDSCGKTNINMTILFPPKYCSNCASKLD